MINVRASTEPTGQKAPVNEMPICRVTPHPPQPRPGVLLIEPDSVVSFSLLSSRAPQGLQDSKVKALLTY